MERFGSSLRSLPILRDMRLIATASCLAALALAGCGEDDDQAAAPAITTTAAASPITSSPLPAPSRAGFGAVRRGEADTAGSAGTGARHAGHFAQDGRSLLPHPAQTAIAGIT